MTDEVILELKDMTSKLLYHLDYISDYAEDDSVADMQRLADMLERTDAKRLRRALSDFWDCIDKEAKQIYEESNILCQELYAFCEKRFGYYNLPRLIAIINEQYEVYNDGFTLEELQEEYGLDPADAIDIVQFIVDKGYIYIEGDKYVPLRYIYDRWLNMWTH